MKKDDTKRIVRLTAILTQLQSKRILTATTLAEKFGVSRRTIYRAHDGLNPAVEGKEVASLIKNARFVSMKYSGHAPIFEEADAYINIVETFFLEN